MKKKKQIENVELPSGRVCVCNKLSKNVTKRFKIRLIPYYNRKVKSVRRLNGIPISQISIARYTYYY